MKWSTVRIVAHFTESVIQRTCTAVGTSTSTKPDDVLSFCGTVLPFCARQRSSNTPTTKYLLLPA